MGRSLGKKSPGVFFVAHFDAFMEEEVYRIKMSFLLTSWKENHPQEIKLTKQV